MTNETWKEAITDTLGDLGDTIVLATLVEAYVANERDIYNLESNEELEDYQTEDLEYNKKLRESVKFVIKYYSTDSERVRLGLDF